MTEAERAVDGAAELFDIPMRPEWREAAITNFEAIAAAARLVMAFPLDDAGETGPVFRP